MGKFEKYSGLFAEQGDFDVPPKLTAGVTTIPSARSVLSFAVGYIWYSSVKSLCNSGSEQALLGSDGGPGFGWENTPVAKVGGAYDVTDAVTLRAGYNYGKQPIPQKETLFNMLAPGVVEHHFTLGGTWHMNENMELTLSYVHALENTVKGQDSIPMAYGGGEADITMSQNTFGLGFGMTF